MRAAVAAFAAQPDPTLAEIGDIKTAVSEAVTNAVVHAYPDKLGTVQVRVRILPDERLEIVVRDHGIGITDVARARTPMYTTGGGRAQRHGLYDHGELHGHVAGQVRAWPRHDRDDVPPHPPPRMIAEETRDLLRRAQAGETLRRQSRWSRKIPA